ncbi:MAG TPA: ATPase domain-containing protein [Xanthobacteraceae bacterium]|nr:ATPase domain-containing protein [Xanthobacteraceae bacterium]
MVQLVPTGIRGLDEILLGGIVRNNTALVKGIAGSGKTLLGIQFVHNGAVQFDEPGIIVSFEANPEKFHQDTQGFGWNLQELHDAGRLELIFTSPEVLQIELDDPQSLLLQRANEIRARRIFIDTVSLFPGADGLSTAGGHGSYRSMLRQMLNNLHRAGLTAVIAHEIVQQGELVCSLEVADVLADTVILVDRGRRERGIYRSIAIEKSRGQDFDAGRHTLLITPGVGIEVFRRVQAEVRELGDQPTSGAKRSLIGVEALDTAFGGGVYEASVTLVVGVSGAGKSLLGYQIAAESAKNGYPALLVSLDEHPLQIQRNANALGLDLGEQVAAGKVRYLHDSPLELEIDTHYHKIKQMIEEHQIERIVLDGLTTYQNAIGDQRIFREFVHGLMAFSKRRLMTTFILYENPEVFGITRFMPDAAISSIVDNILLLSFVEVGNEVRRSLTVIKARGCAHDLVSREFTIGTGGICLVADPGGGLKTPFNQLDSLLSRAPKRRRHAADEQDNANHDGTAGTP